MYEYEQVKKDVAEEYAKSVNGAYRCVSALKSSGINELFEFVGMCLLKNEGKEPILEDYNKSENDKKNNKNEFTLKKEEKKDEKQKKKCC